MMVVEEIGRAKCEVEGGKDEGFGFDEIDGVGSALRNTQFLRFEDTLMN